MEGVHLRMTEQRPEAALGVTLQVTSYYYVLSCSHSGWKASHAYVARHVRNGTVGQWHADTPRKLDAEVRNTERTFEIKSLTMNLGQHR